MTRQPITKRVYTEEQQADYFDYEDNTSLKDYFCPYCTSPSPDIHAGDCPVNEFES